MLMHEMMKRSLGGDVGSVCLLIGERAVNVSPFYNVIGFLTTVFQLEESVALRLPVFDIALLSVVERAMFFIGHGFGQTGSDESFGDAPGCFVI